MKAYEQTIGQVIGREFDLQGHCDLCKKDDCDPIYDAEVPYMDSWGWMCQDCFTEHNCKIGLGLGQKYKRITLDSIR